MINLFQNGILTGGLLALNDVVSMTLSKQIVLGNLIDNWLIVPIILYGFQMYMFYYGLKYSGMGILNLTWNLISNILITIIGIFYFKENINNLETYGILFAVFSLFLFGLAQYQKI